MSRLALRSHSHLFSLISSCFVLATFLSFAGLAEAQVNPGYPSFTPQDCGQYDCINLQNLNVSLNVPVMSKTGAFPFNLVMSGADSYVYSLAGALNPGVIYTPLRVSANGLVGLLVPAGYGTPTSATCPSADGSGSASEYDNFHIITNDGTFHYFPVTDVIYTGATCSSSFTDQTIDGSGFTMTVSGSGGNLSFGTIYTSSGATFTGDSLTDSNGNKISYSPGTGVFTDTLGLTAATANTADSGAIGSASWTDVNGGSPAVTPTYTTYTLKSSFGCSGATDYTAGDSLPTSFSFPDSTTLGLAWEPNEVTSTDSTGRLQKITLRGGGTITYNWNATGAGSSGHYGLNCVYLVPTSVTRTTSDGTVTYATSFSTISPYVETVTKLDIEKNKTVYSFTGFTSTGNAAAPTAQVMTEIQSFINAGTVASPSYSSTPTKQVIYCYNSTATSSSGCSTASVILPVLEVSAFTTIDGTSSASWTSTTYDHYGNPLVISQYDFGATSPTVVTTNVYSPTGSCGPSSTVNNKLCSIVTTISGSTVASSKYTYSSTGNLLTTYISNNGGSTFFSNPTVNSYNANGTPSVLYDLQGNSTTYAYEASGYTGSPTNLPFATKITAANGLYTQATYNSVGGVKLTDVDAALNTTTYGYTDYWNRVTSITDPLNNVVNQSYSATSLASTFSFNSANSVNNVTTTLDGYGRPILTQKQQWPPSSPNYDTVQTLYGFAPPPQYDEHYVYSSVPCTAAAGGGCGSFNYVYYDMLNRVLETTAPSGEYVTTQHNGGTSGSTTREDLLSTLGPASSGENTKKVQTEYDGLGRVTSTCAISTVVSGNGSCGQVTGGYSGILTTYTYPTSTGLAKLTLTRGSQSRGQTVDGFGRVVTVFKAETSTPAISNYYDWVPSACSGSSVAFAGKLIESVDANGNFQCYLYDTLGRVTAITGSNGTTTICRRFAYDSTANEIHTQPSGSTLSNLPGRLMEAETDNCSTPITAITDEWFSYDKDGHQTDGWELTPGYSSYYHWTTGSSGYAGNGAITSLQLASPSLGTYTYTLDGEGRWNAMDQGSTTWVSATTYDAASSPLKISIGSGSDYDQYTYDSSERMSGWTFQVDSVQETGTPTWNTNNTLEELYIHDGFNPGGTQYCGFNSGLFSGTGYDDLNRLIGMNCGPTSPSSTPTIWNQTFSFSQYDNLNKSSSGPGTSWTTAYIASNNHYSPSTTYTYDSSGNLTYDTFHNYTWDQYNKLLSVDLSGTDCATSGECMTYDAFGRMVEMDSGSVKTSFWYTPIGKLSMVGATENKAYLAAPGGGTVLYDGSNYDFMHKDFLGSARIVSNISASTIYSDQAISPYGEIYDQFGNTSQYPQNFTGDTQGILAGMWDTPNRELTNIGRFLSPDPANSGWNQYAYPTNPNSQIDPSGLVCDLDCGDGGGDGGDGGGSGLEGTDPSGGSCDPTQDPFCVFNPITPPGGLPGSGGGSGSGGAGGVGGPGTGGGSNILPGEDCAGCWSLGPSPLQFLQAILSGNIVGALQDVGAVPTDGLDCTSGVCMINPIMDAEAANNGYIVVNGNYLFPSNIDNKYNLMEKGQSNYRDLNPLCSTHATVDQTTSQTQSHVDLFNPSVPLPAYYPVDMSSASIPLHLIFDALPDAIYRATGMYLIPAGRTACQ